MKHDIDALRTGSDKHAKTLDQLSSAIGRIKATAGEMNDELTLQKRMLNEITSRLPRSTTRQPRLALPPSLLSLPLSLSPQGSSIFSSPLSWLAWATR